MGDLLCKSLESELLENQEWSSEPGPGEIYMAHLILWAMAAA